MRRTKSPSAVRLLSAARKSARLETLRRAASVITMPTSSPARSAGPSGSTPTTTKPSTLASRPYRRESGPLTSPTGRQPAGLGGTAPRQARDGHRPGPAEALGRVGVEPADPDSDVGPPDPAELGEVGGDPPGPRRRDGEANALIAAVERFDRRVDA